jgi:hypothetical protein
MPLREDSHPSLLHCQKRRHTYAYSTVSLIAEDPCQWLELTDMCSLGRYAETGPPGASLSYHLQET